MGRCNMCCLHVVLSVFITLHTYVVTCRTPSKAYKRQTNCKSGRKRTKKAFLTKGYTEWLETMIECEILNIFVKSGKC